MQTSILHLFGWVLMTITLVGCSSAPVRTYTEQNVAIAWAELSLDITKTTPANSPTFASRAFGYLGVTMYESVVHGYPEYRSLAGQLNELDALPEPEHGAVYHWPLALNAGQAAILRSIYVQTSDANKARIDSLEAEILDYFSPQLEDEAVIDRSITYGQSVADAIFAWSQTDGGHRGYLKNFDKKLVHPTQLGCWQPPLYAQSFSHYPLHPHWGRNRTFVPGNAALALPEMIAYDSTEGSEYYRQFLSVYEKERNLTEEEKEIALWWGDDPDVTFTPPGHSYYLATVALKRSGPPLIECAETYARVGMAVADAFINCWKWKYHFFTERPNTFVTRHIDPAWESFWPDPPFPAFPSGHAIQAAAAATVLTELHGEPFHFVDSAHAGRPRDELRGVEFRPRSFDSFWAVALETANSRFYGGIHTPRDNEAGLENGRRIGGNVNALRWRVKNKSISEATH